MKIGTKNQIVGCLGCLGIFALLMLVQMPRIVGDIKSQKAGEGSAMLRTMAAAHAAKPEVTAFSYAVGKGGDAGWKALGLPEDSKYHSYDAWTDADGRLWMTAIGNLDGDAPLSEWEWPGPVASPVQIRSDRSDEWQGLYFHHYDHGQMASVDAHPQWSHEERMEIARRRAIYDSALALRWATEKFGDQHLEYRVQKGVWDVEGTTPGDERFHFLVKVTNGTEMTGVAGFANFDGDACVDMWRVRFPDRTAEHVADDVDDRGCERP